ncbi:hypothetical protein [Sorangium sp. So ce124]|uniref:hypothetical protein n=1 Tax=Sorangium sp. So ce124 TaxID=3133280 RepID=UPI003F5F265C
MTERTVHVMRGAPSPHAAAASTQAAPGEMSKTPSFQKSRTQMMMVNRSELLDAVYRFYPRGVRNFDRIYLPPNEPFYDDTEEHRRLVEAANRGRAQYPTWEAMIHRMYERYSLRNSHLGRDHLLQVRYRVRPMCRDPIRSIWQCSGRRLPPQS